MLLLESRYDLAVRDVDGISVEIVPLAELAAARVWISNWSRMLPVINARSLLPKSLSKSILGRVHGPEPVACVERDLAVGDPAIVRGAFFELLRTGRPRAPSLHFQPLDLYLILEPAT